METRIAQYGFREDQPGNFHYVLLVKQITTYIPCVTFFRTLDMYWCTRLCMCQLFVTISCCFSIEYTRISSLTNRTLRVKKVSFNRINIVSNILSIHTLGPFCLNKKRYNHSNLWLYLKNDFICYS